jgi:hypothetical protein
MAIIAAARSTASSTHVLPVLLGVNLWGLSYVLGFFR